MKALGIGIGLAALVIAGSANATVVYDTITGQTTVGSAALTTSGFRAPLGNDFNIPTGGATVNSVTLGMFDNTCAGNAGSACSDAGSTLVYLVPGTGSPSLPSTSSNGLTLNGAIYVGTILDTQLIKGTTGSSTQNLITLNTNIGLSAGTWWLMLTPSSDPNNVHGTVNSTPSTAKLGEISAAAVGTVGVPLTGWFTAGANASDTGILGGVSQNSTVGAPSPDNLIFQEAITTSAPEPASLALLGVGMAGLGMIRRRRAKKSAS